MRMHNNKVIINFTSPIINKIISVIITTESLTYIIINPTFIEIFQALLHS